MKLLNFYSSLNKKLNHAPNIFFFIFIPIIISFIIMITIDNINIKIDNTNILSINNEEIYNFSTFLLLYWSILIIQDILLLSILIIQDITQKLPKTIYRKYNFFIKTVKETYKEECV